MTHPVAVAEDVAWLFVDDPAHVGRARRAATALAEQLVFDESRVAEVGLAVTEIAANLHKHAGEGHVLVRALRAGDRAAVEVVSLDAGPGIADTALAMVDGQSTAGTLGIGLGMVARSADHFDVTSRRGRGTVLSARFHARSRDEPPFAADPAVAGLTRPLAGEQHCGDAYTVRRTADGRLWLMMCDGSGHGPLAATASRAAVRAFTEDEPTSPEAVVARLHAALRGTRGGAVAAAVLDPVSGVVRFAGLGNIAGAVLADGHKRSMVSVPGIAGFQARGIKAFDYELPPGARVVLHSDGLTERWSPEDVAGVTSPLLLAATLVRDAAVRRDDAGVLVAAP
ncbi:anti-sigma regulatory factor (Ser/Thr protein kinase) [Saccharothrix saharensis]|uniref:Anti-sigma regulatory factor (Ser/Thr protein kinase) n=1 Tax=Saccharothrix saharensis TaxID=571190 RepID=A0A543JRH3_9PSEU|nr:anti-sigma regulatory factor (Ser/Thr protein kinase) [Saccharothrix saharensis]